MSEQSSASSSKIRNARACESCRASKSRCIFQSQLGICQRCEQNGTQCSVRTKARPMRSRKTTSSMTQGMSEMRVSNDAEFTIDLPAVEAPDSTEHIIAIHEQHKDFFGEAGVLQARKIQCPGSTGTNDHSVIVSRRRITLTEAESLLSAYRKKAAFFPFVHIPPEHSVPYLSKTSPFLLLAILTSASIADPNLYYQMDLQFKHVLSAKVITEGQRSLDFLQGLLLYIAWYPAQINTKNNQSFMYMNLAISMAIELGLHEETPTFNPFNNCATTGLIDNGSFTPAAKKAYLACYYLSSNISLTFKMPNNLAYCSLMDIHGQTMMSTENSPEVYALVRLQRLLEQVNQAHSTNNAGQGPHMSFEGEVNIQLFSNVLQDWHNAVPENTKNSPIVALAERSVRIAIYSQELGLNRRPYRDYVHSMDITTVNHSHLFGCLEASKSFFEYLLSIHEINYTQFSAVHWCYVVDAILLLSRLTFMMAAALGWNAETTRSNIPLVMYIDCMCYRFQTLSPTSYGTETPQSPDGLYVFKMVLESVKRSYEQRVRNIDQISVTIPQGHPMVMDGGHCPMLDPSLSVYFETPEYNYEDLLYDASGTSVTQTVPTTAPFYHDLWATMTGSWAEEF